MQPFFLESEKNDTLGLLNEFTIKVRILAHYERTPNLEAAGLTTETCNTSGMTAVAFPHLQFGVRPYSELDGKWPKLKRHLTSI